MMQIRMHEYIIHIHIIELEGRLEAATIPPLREAQDTLLMNGGKYFVVDLQNVTFMDSAGMAALVSLLKRARQAGGDVVLVRPTEPLAFRILSLTRFDQVFLICSTREEAQHYF